jgi:hypothetical protein
MALRFCLLALSLIVASSSGVLAASDQSFPPGPPPMGPGGPMTRTMEGMQPPGGPMGPITPMPQTRRTCECEFNWDPLPWGPYGMCQFGTRTCQTCRIVIIDGKRSELCEITTEPCGQCVQTTTTTW